MASQYANSYTEGLKSLCNKYHHFPSYLLNKEEPPSHRTLNLNELKDIYSLIYPVSTGYKLIRLGERGDGGYLIPNCLEGIEMCFSPGTAEQFQFELDLDRIFNIPSIMCDPSIERPKGLSEKLSFEKLSIGYENKNGMIKLSSWIKKHIEPKENSLMLSLDIEGGEWKVFMEEDHSFLKNFKIMTFELHFLSYLHDTEFVKDYFIPVINNIKSKFDIVHVHPQNGSAYCGMYSEGENDEKYLCDCLEFTCLSKSFRLKEPVPSKLPHPLDHIMNPSYKQHLFL